MADVQAVIPGIRALATPSRKPGADDAFGHVGLSPHDDLHVAPLRVGAVMQREGRVIGDRTVVAEVGGGQEAVDRPCRSAGTFAHRREDTTGDTPEIASSKVQSGHRSDNPVLWAAAQSRAGRPGGR